MAGCYYDSEEELYPEPASGGGCDTTNLTYATDIEPILNTSCSLPACHDAATKSSGYDLSNYSGAVAATGTGRLTGAIMHSPGFSPMPKGMQKLKDCDISKIIAWINAGTPQ